MVCDSYTNTNEGGIGIHMLNRGYTQLVSVFTICCHIAIKCETGGFCSITNSNASFGTYALYADGVSEALYYGKLRDDTLGQEFVFTNLSQRPNYGDSILFATYNQDKCARDSGLIVDSLAFDLAYTSNSQSNFAGLQYWSQTDSAIPNQSIETRNAINVAAQIAVQLAQGTTVSQVYQSNVSPSNGTGGTAVEAARLQTNFNVVVAGSNAIYNNEKYSYSFFMNQLAGCNSINDNHTDGISSSLINQLDFETLYNYYYVDISRCLPVEKSVPKSISITGQNLSAVSVDLYCFVCFTQEIQVD